MAYTIKSVEVWAVDVYNRAGMLARILEALANVGGNLEFVVGRRVNENTGRIFVAPIKGKKQEKAARDLGLQPAKGLYALRIEGPDKPGLGAKITRAIAAAGVNIRGISAAAPKKQSICYVAFATAADAALAAKVVKKAISKK